MELNGVKLIGFSQHTLDQLLLTLAVIGALTLVRLAVVRAAHAAVSRPGESRALFWTRQGTSLAVFVLALVAAAAIWFDDPSRLSGVIGVVTAGVAIASQKAVTSFRRLSRDHARSDVHSRRSHQDGARARRRD